MQCLTFFARVCAHSITASTVEVPHKLSGSSGSKVPFTRHQKATDLGSAPSLGRPGAISTPLRQLGLWFPTFEPVVYHPARAVPAGTPIAVRYTVRTSGVVRSGQLVRFPAAKAENQSVAWGITPAPGAAWTCGPNGDFLECAQRRVKPCPGPRL